MRDALAPLILSAAASIACAQSPFATRVMSYTPQPGQNINNPQFNDPARALGPPVGGGTAAADNTKVVTLGGFGGQITLGFDHPILNQPPTPTNPTGADLIVFGNAFFVGGDDHQRWAEPGVIEVSRDDNNNGLADDLFYVIRGSHLPAVPEFDTVSVQFNGASLPTSWLPPGRSASSTWWAFGYRLNDPTFNGASFVLASGDIEGTQTVHGYADCAPTMVRGDFDGDGITEREGVDPAWFYTIPTSPLRTSITPWSGGGEAIDISAAVDINGAAPNQPLTHIDFIRIRTAVNIVRPPLGESSAEIAAVAEVRARKRADIGGQGGLIGPDGALDNNDFVIFINLFFTQSPLADIGVQGGIAGSDSIFDNNDFVVFIDWFFQAS